MAAQVFLRQRDRFGDRFCDLRDLVNGARGDEPDDDTADNQDAKHHGHIGGLAGQPGMAENPGTDAAQNDRKQDRGISEQESFPNPPGKHDRNREGECKQNNVSGRFIQKDAVFPAEANMGSWNLGLRQAAKRFADPPGPNKESWKRAR